MTMNAQTLKRALEAHGYQHVEIDWKDAASARTGNGWAPFPHYLHDCPHEQCPHCGKGFKAPGVRLSRLMVQIFIGGELVLASSSAFLEMAGEQTVIQCIDQLMLQRAQASLVHALNTRPAETAPTHPIEPTQDIMPEVKWHL